MKHSAGLLLCCGLIHVSGVAADRPQTPQPPYPYLTRDVTLVNPADGTRLAGTLTLPAGKGRVPAVVLAPGAGAVDRDDSIMGHKPFLVLADHLSRQGIASLRLDSRGIGGSSGDYAQSNGEALAGDLLAAVEYLKQQPEIKSEAVGMVGHSQGGLVAAIAAARSPSVRFLICLAAPGLSDTELLALRIAAAGPARGLSPAAIEQLQKSFRDARTRMLRGEKDAPMINAFVDAVKIMLPAGVNPPPPALVAAVEHQMAEARKPNTGFFLALEPRTVFARLLCPVLALNGSLDRNVPAQENLAAIETALAEGKNAKAKTVLVEGLNHFFQTTQGGSPLEVGQIEETISPRALDLISAWIRAQF